MTKEVVVQTLDTDASGSPFGRYTLDPILQYVGGQGLADFDLGAAGSDICWPGGNPVNGSVIPDLAEKGSLSMRVASGDTVSYAGGGFDFSACAKGGNNIVTPGGIFAPIYSYGGSRRYLIVGYYKLPTLANWPNAGGAQVTLWDTGLYVTGPAVQELYMATVGGNPILAIGRQTLAATAQFLSLPTITSAYAGKVCQIASWYDAATTTWWMRLRTAGQPDLLAVQTAAPDNTQNYSTVAMTFGISSVTNYWPATLTTEYLKARNFRLYAGAVINLCGISYDVPTILNNDWTDRMVNRTDFT